MKWQITAFVNDRDMLYKFQSGYRRRYSTTTALLRVTQDLRENLSRRFYGKRYVSFLMLLDFSSAFDLVNHQLLLEKLRKLFNFSNDALNLIRSYLSNRSQTVTIDTHMSDSLSTKNGVPLGSVLGPLLFSLFINDLPTVIKHCTCHLFADDVQLYRHHDWHDFKSGVDLINSD